MNEREIRSRLKRAIGDSAYPPTLTRAVEARMTQPATAGGHAGLLSLVATVLAALIVLSLVAIRAQSIDSHRSHAGPTASPRGDQIPAQFLADVGLSAAVAVIARPNLVVTDRARTVILAGAYADPTRTVLIFRTLPSTARTSPAVMFDGFDQRILGGLGDPDDGYVAQFVLTGPHAGPDGVAHLNVAISEFHQSPVTRLQPTAASPARQTDDASSHGVWNFAFDLKVQPATSVNLVPSLKSIGPYTITNVAAGFTPSVVYFQAVFSGPTSSRLWEIGFTDASGNGLVSGGTEDPVNDSPVLTQVRFFAFRPTKAMTVLLIVTFEQTKYVFDIHVPPPPTI